MISTEARRSPCQTAGVVPEATHVKAGEDPSSNTMSRFYDTIIPIATVDVETQTDTKLLEYIAELDADLLEAYKTISGLKDELDQLKLKCSEYRYLWMSECRYSSVLIKEGAELAGGWSQVKDWESSSPYYRRMCPILIQLS